MKKVFKGMLLSSLALMLSVAVGCSSQQNTSSPTAEQPKAEEKSAYPTKPIEVVVPAGAGGDTDRNTRVIAKYLEKELGQPVVVTNVGGAGGSTGTKKVLDANADGYTVLSFHNSMLLNKIMGLVDFSYPEMELAGIGISDLGNTFMVNSNSQFTDLPSLIEYAKANPKKVSIATEVGGFTHLQLLALQQATGTEFNIVDVGGAAEKLTALLGGQIDINPTAIGLVKSYIDSGELRSLGVMADERISSMPDVPTFKEQGVDIVFDKFFFWGFPKGTPQEVVSTFSAALEKVVNNEELKKELDGFVVTPVYMNGEEAVKHMTEAEAYYKQLLGK
ncbi:tripartite tricarboxylate transporter substrate binding protein [Ammoniphilus sp. YIM 78166]|uniref:tripartite tricarboxylate transporter substrate binding protein n=1 Tax=Ammoniphilus sp. YIM 78166 TaxID=1644106 RepID=UPI00106F176A|nr:tripartite tricarboxylate transporter substrate binding protein [Ammoniphilus sp. YIM 78166]